MKVQLLKLCVTWPQNFPCPFPQPTQGWENVPPQRVTGAESDHMAGAADIILWTSVPNEANRPQNVEPRHVQNWVPNGMLTRLSRQRAPRGHGWGAREGLCLQEGQSPGTPALIRGETEAEK